MISIRDGLGRELYVIDSSNPDQRLHPHSLEKMPDDWQMEYPNCNIGIWPWLAMFVLFVVVGFLIFTR